MTTTFMARSAKPGDEPAMSKTARPMQRLQTEVSTTDIAPNEKRAKSPRATSLPNFCCDSYAGDLPGWVTDVALVDSKECGRAIEPLRIDLLEAGHISRGVELLRPDVPAVPVAVVIGQRSNDNPCC